MEYWCEIGSAMLNTVSVLFQTVLNVRSDKSFQSFF